MQDATFIIAVLSESAVAVNGRKKLQVDQKLHALQAYSTPAPTSALDALIDKTELMLNWFYKFRPLGTPVTPPKSTLASVDVQPPSSAAASAARAPVAKAPAVPRTDPDGPLRLQAALGDDAALLQLALSAQGLDLKLAAVQAIDGEAVLKQTERAFRGHDRKVHRLAKQRLETAVSQRLGRAQAERLLAQTAALLQEAEVPLNYVVALDRDWAALPAALLQDTQKQQFAALRSQLEKSLRERSDAKQQLQRWTVDATQHLQRSPAILLALAEQGPLSDLAAQEAGLLALLSSRPEASAGQPLEAALTQQLATCQALAARLAWLELPDRGDPTAADPTDADPTAADPTAADPTAADPTAADPKAADPIAADLRAADPFRAEADWAALPDVADPAIAQALQQRFLRWQQQHQPPALAAPPRQPHRSLAEAAPARAAAAARGPKAIDLNAEQLAQLDTLLQQAEAALAEGQGAVMQQRLQALEAWVASAGPGAALPGHLRARHLALRAESLRLKDWQRWGGSRARDELVAQAETLARLTIAATAPPTTGQTAEGTEDAQGADGADGAEGAEGAEAVEAAENVEPADTAKTTDVAGSAESSESSESSESAESAEASESSEASEASGGVEGIAAREPRQQPQPPAPVVVPSPAPRSERAARRRPPKLKLQAHADAIAALRARWKSLDRAGAAAPLELWQRFDAALQTAFGPVAAQHAAAKAARQDNLAAREALLLSLETLTPPAGDATFEARNLQQGLDRFQLAWRRLGPIEHTAPQAARAALLQRLEAALARVELPLQAAHSAAAAQREQLIARALALGPDPQDTSGGFDSARQVRELQFAWQEQARKLPLPRALEREVWGRFKAATDAVFAQREAGLAARDSEMATNLATAQALLERVEALTASTPAPQLARTLAEVDLAWRQGGPVPRSELSRLETRYSAATAAAAQHQQAALRQAWQALCDGLSARLVLCEARESGALQAAAVASQAPQADGDGDASHAATPASLAERWAALDALPAAWQQVLAQRWAQPVATSAVLPTAALDDLLLQLEMALGLPATPARQTQARQLKLRALKEAMEGRPAAKPAGALPADWLLAVLRQPQLTLEQHQRLHAWLAALRQAAPGSLGLPLAAA